MTDTNYKDTSEMSFLRKLKSKHFDEVTQNKISLQHTSVYLNGAFHKSIHNTKFDKLKTRCTKLYRLFFSVKAVIFE